MSNLEKINTLWASESGDLRQILDELIVLLKQADETGEKESFVKMEEFDEVSDLFRSAIAKLMLQVISYELSEHLEAIKKEG